MVLITKKAWYLYLNLFQAIHRSLHISGVFFLIYIYILIGCSSILLPYINYTVHLFIQSTKNYYLHTTVWIQIKHPDYCVDYSMIKKSNFPVCIHICHSRFLSTLIILINFLLVWMIIWHISFLRCVYPGLNRNHWWQWIFFVYVEVKIEEHSLGIGICIDRNNVWHLKRARNYL